MSSQHFITARAPSNIALIKYMGKEDSKLNLPANASISMTLNGLCSIAQVRRVAGGGKSVFIPELPNGVNSHALVTGVNVLNPSVPLLSEEGVTRALRQVERVRAAAARIFPFYDLKLAEVSGLELRTANTFPPASGIASSASSLAAITLASAAACAENVEAFEKAWAGEVNLRRDCAAVSRQGSGSSCRSFEGPWVLWDGEEVAALNGSMPEMTDFVLIVESGPKAISSSRSHELVRTSPLWYGRVERVAERIRTVEAALGEADFTQLAKTVWSESWEMHSLFHTCAEPFTYWVPGTMEILRWIAPYVLGASRLEGAEKPPIVTLDAGPNVHILVPTSSATVWRAALSAQFDGVTLLEDRQGTGAVTLGCTG